MAWWVYAGILVASYLYNEYLRKKPPKPKPASELALPRIDEGANAPLVFGRCRVRSPILAWTSAFRAPDDGTSPSGFNYRMDMHLIIGIPFQQTSSKLHGIWFGDMKLDDTWGQLSNLLPWDGTAPANPPTKSARVTGPNNRETGIISGYVQFYDGKIAGKPHTDPVGPAAWSHLGKAMLFDGESAEGVPGYRGYLSVAHFHDDAFTPPDNKFQLGASPSIGALSYEVSSYPAFSDAMNVGLEANPAMVLIDVLTGTFGKLGLDNAKIHGPSFLNAKIRLQEEGNGYSRCIEAGTDAGEILREICEQIGGVLFEDNRDGLIKLKLIRPDYDPNAIPHITTSNAKLESFVPGGWEGIPNKVRGIFYDRNRDYQESSATAHNQAVAANHNNEASELVLHYPGCCTRELAEQLVSRDLSNRSRPLAKCTALVNRDFSAVNPGDPVKLTWPEYGVDGRVFRVAAVNRGTLSSRRIRLDLVEDFSFVWRGVVGEEHPLPPHPEDLPVFE